MRFLRSIRPRKPAQADEGYQRYDAYSKLLDRNGRWIEVADTKAAVVLGFLIAVFPLLFAPAIPAVRRLASAIPRGADFWHHLPAGCLVVLISAFALAAVMTLVRVLRVLTPRLTKSPSRASLLFFGDVAIVESIKWHESMLSLDFGSLAEQVLEQVYATAIIADRKHRLAQGAIRSLLLTVFLGLALFVVGQLVG
jgi:hypothetical protein